MYVAQVINTNYDFMIIVGKLIATKVTDQR